MFLPSTLVIIWSEPMFHIDFIGLEDKMGSTYRKVSTTLPATLPATFRDVPIQLLGSELVRMLG